MLENFKKAYDIIWIHSGWALLYIMLIGWGILRRKLLPKNLFILFLGSFIVSVIAFNPLALQIASRVGIVEYTRIAWGMLLIPVIAAFITYIVAGKDNSQGIDLILVICVLWLLTMKNRKYFELPLNIYKISPEAIEISEILIDDGGENSVHLVAALFPVDKNPLYDMSPWDRISTGISSYTSCYMLQMETIENIEQADVLYPYVVTDVKEYESSILDSGYHIIGTTENYTIYAK